jgi:hypothetical protein
MEPTAYVTLATNGQGDIHEMTRLIGRFCGMVDRELLGNKWHKLPREQRSDGIFFIEHAATNIHAHGFLKFPKVDGFDLPLLAALKWSRLTEAGTTDFKWLDDKNRCAYYSTKEMTSARFEGDQMVLVGQFIKDDLPLRISCRID